MSTYGKRWSTLDLEEARRLYEDGMSFRQVGRHLGFSESYIARRFRRDGVPCRAADRPLPTPAPEVDPADIVRRKQGGESVIAIAAALGISGGISRDMYLQEVGLQRRAPRVRAFRARRPVEDQGSEAMGEASRAGQGLGLSAPKAH